MYLDRTFLPPRNLISTFQMGIDLFRDNVLFNQYFKIEKSTMAALLNLIKFDRDCVNVDKDLLRNVVRIFSELTIKREKCNSATKI